MKLTAILIGIVISTGCAAQTPVAPALVAEAQGEASAASAPTYASSAPRAPRPGEQLGYSKEESIRRLDPQVRQLLDVVLRLYTEPGLFTNRTAAISALGTRVEKHIVYEPTDPPRPGPKRFRDDFAKMGIFSRPAWSGSYEYFGWWPRPSGLTWYASMQISIDGNIECNDSRAVEGYLRLFLQPGLDRRSHLVLAEFWDRHGEAGSPYALRQNRFTPGVGFGFVRGCLVRITMGDTFRYEDINDDDVHN